VVSCYKNALSTSREVGSESVGCCVRGVAGVAVVLAVLWSPATAGGQAEPKATTTTSSTSSTTLHRAPGCSSPGDFCGNCGPAGQCLEHVDAAPPARVCVNGGFCVELGCSSDAQCGGQQVCATLGEMTACCPPCP